MSPNAILKSPLWILHGLSNHDKHRMLALSVLGTTCRWQFVTRDGVLIREDFLQSRMYDGAIVGSFPRHFLDEKVKIQSQITCDVSFQDDPAAGIEVAAVTHSARVFIGKCLLPRFEAFFDPLPDHLKLVNHGLTDDMLRAPPPP